MLPSCTVFHWSPTSMMQLNGILLLYYIRYHTSLHSLTSSAVYYHPYLLRILLPFSTLKTKTNKTTSTHSLNHLLIIIILSSRHHYFSNPWAPRILSFIVLPWYLLATLTDTRVSSSSAYTTPPFYVLLLQLLQPFHMCNMRHLKKMMHPVPPLEDRQQLRQHHHPRRYFEGH